MHPSEMQSFFAPPMPFHPEELHKHVTELERAFGQLPSEDLNARTAVAKATVAAVAAFMEGSIREQAMLRSTGYPRCDVTVGQRRVPGSARSTTHSAGPHGRTPLMRSRWLGFHLLCGLATVLRNP